MCEQTWSNQTESESSMAHVTWCSMVLQYLKSSFRATRACRLQPLSATRAYLQHGQDGGRM